MSPLPPYRFASGDQHGDEAPAPEPTYGRLPPARLAFVDRARLARRRRTVDPAWKDRTPESRRLLLDLDRREEQR